MFDKIGTAAGILILLMLMIIVILAVVTVSMSARLSRLSRRYQAFMKGRDGESLEKALISGFGDLDRISDQSVNNSIELKSLKKSQQKTLTKYGIVKYDAFDDVGGKMSFALAMLDSENSGFILDTVHSRDNCFVYLKEIVKGESYIMLSNEEIEALKQAAGDMEEEI